MSLPVMLRAGSILATGELLETTSNSSGNVQLITKHDRELLMRSIRSDQDSGSDIPARLDVLSDFFTSVNVHKDTWHAYKFLQNISRILNKNKTRAPSISDILKRLSEYCKWSILRW